MQRDRKAAGINKMELAARVTRFYYFTRPPNVKLPVRVRRADGAFVGSNARWHVRKFKDKFEYFI